MIVTGIDKKIETVLIETFDVTTIEQSIIERFLPPNLPENNNTPSVAFPKADLPITLNVTIPTQAPEIPATLTNWINSNPLTMANLK